MNPHTVASEWHGGQWTALYAFASTGSIVEGVLAEVEQCIRDIAANPSAYDADESSALDDLHDYLTSEGATT